MKKTSCLPLWCGLFGLAVALANAASPDVGNIVWHSPSKDHHGSMPLGNGSTAVNAWINPAGELEFYLSRTDSWGDNARLLKVGKIRVTMDPPPPLTPFEQTLSLKDATMIVRYGAGAEAATLRLWVDANHPAIHVTIDSATPRTATAAIELWRTNRFPLPSLEVSDVLFDRSKPGHMHAPTIVEPDTVLTGQSGRIGWYHRNIKSVGPRLHAEVQGMTGYPRPDPLLHRIFGALITAENGERRDDTHLVTPRSRHQRFSIFVDTMHPATTEEWLAQMDAHIAAFAKDSFAARRRAHEAWWAERWNRSWIVAEESPNARSSRRIPTNAHPVRLGADQGGGSRLAAGWGRVSLIARALTPEEIAALAGQAPDQPLADPSAALYSAVTPTAGAIDQSAGWTFGRGLTLEAWIRPTQPGAGGGRLIDKITPGGSDGFLFDTHGGLRLIVGRVTLQTKTKLPVGKWSHLAAVIPPGGEPLRLFVNGQEVARSARDELSDARVVTRAYALQRFITLCAGRGAYPIKFNGSIFTVPAEGKPGNADYRRWGPGYWWQNTRLPYVSLCASGDTDLMRPLFAQYIDRFLPLNLYRTWHYFKHGGAYYIECVHFWGDVFNESYGWTPPADQRTDKLQQSGYHKWEWVAGPELVYMALDYYDHTGDEAFLQRKAIPTADAVLRFFDEHYPTNAQGKLVMHPSQALETWWDTTNPLPEVAGLRAVTKRLLALPERLTTSDQRAYWTAFLKKLPPLPTREVDGQRAFAPAARFAAKRNIENPELYCVFPFRLASFNRPNADLARNALAHRWDKGNNGWRQDDIFMAYLGLTDQARDYLVGRARACDSGSRFPAFWGPNYDWIPDQDHGSVLMKAFQAMVLQTEPALGEPDDGKMFLLPAWPRDWRLEFKLHAPGRTTIEGRYQNGRLTGLRVTPPERRKDLVIPADIKVTP